MRSFSRTRRWGLATLVGAAVLVGASSLGALLAAPSADALVAPEPPAPVNAGVQEITVVDGGASLAAVSCPATGWCAVGDGNGKVLLEVGGTWQKPVQVFPAGDGVDGVSCPSTSYCMAVSYLGGWADWSAGKWSRAKTSMTTGGGWGVSCASATFCMAEDGAFGDIDRWNGSGWSLSYDGSSDPNDGLGQSSAPIGCELGSTSLCSYVDNGDYANHWNGTKWSPTAAIAKVRAEGLVSCAEEPLTDYFQGGHVYPGSSENVCDVVDANGDTYWWNGSTWAGLGHPDSGTTFDTLVGLSCVYYLCAAVDGDHNVLYEAVASGGAGGWSKPYPMFTSATSIAVSCANYAFCLAITSGGEAVTLDPQLPSKGYWLASADGTVTGFGGVRGLGGASGVSSTDPVVGIAATPTANGYFVVTRNGTVTGRGDAVQRGDLPSLGVRVSDIVGIAPTADGKGYWLIGADGGEFPSATPTTTAACPASASTSTMSSAWSPRPTARATSSWAPTAASSPSVLRGTTAACPASASTSTTSPGSSRPAARRAMSSSAGTAGRSCSATGRGTTDRCRGRASTCPTWSGSGSRLTSTATGCVSPAARCTRSGTPRSTPAMPSCPRRSPRSPAPDPAHGVRTPSASRHRTIGERASARRRSQSRLPQPGGTTAPVKVPVTLGIDLGTGSVKVAFVDREGNDLAQASVPYQLSAGEAGTAEIDAEVWWTATRTAVRHLLAIEDVVVQAVGVSGQMHGVVVVDEHLRPLAPAVTWADRRSPELVAGVARLAAPYRPDLANDVSSGMAAVTLRWFGLERPQLLERASKVLQPKDWLGGRLSGVGASDVTDASATLLWDFGRDDWHREWLRALEIDPRLLPEVRPGDEVRDVLTDGAAGEVGLGRVPVVVGRADTASALIGSSTLRPGTTQLTWGTGGQLCRVVERMPAVRLGTNLFAGPTERQWYLMAATMTAGLALEWVRRTHRLSWDDLYAEAFSSPPGAQGVVFLPYVAGERGHETGDALHAGWVGARLHHTRADLLRAAFEGCAYALADAWDALGPGDDDDARPVTIAGGGTNDRRWRQLVSDVLGRPLQVPLRRGGAPRAAALAAAVALGWFVDIVEAAGTGQGRVTVCEPGRDAAGYEDARRRYRQAVDRAATL